MFHKFTIKQQKNSSIFVLLKHKNVLSASKILAMFMKNILWFVFVQICFLCVAQAQNVKDMRTNKVIYYVDGTKLKEYSSKSILYQLKGTKIVRHSDQKSVYHFDGEKLKSLENQRNLLIIKDNKIKTAHNGRTMFLIDGEIIKNARNNQRILKYPLNVSQAFLLLILLERN